jgi:hypothetical protein
VTCDDRQRDIQVSSKSTWRWRSALGTSAIIVENPSTDSINSLSACWLVLLFTHAPRRCPTVWAVAQRKKITSNTRRSICCNDGSSATVVERRQYAERRAVSVGRSTGTERVDNLSRQERSEIMGRVRSKNSRPELVVRRLVFSLGYRYRLHDRRLPGCPDSVFREEVKSFLCTDVSGIAILIAPWRACRNRGSTSGNPNSKLTSRGIEKTIVLLRARDGKS